MPDATALVLRIVAGEPALWPQLQALIQPTIVAIARSHADMRKRGLAMLEDELSEISTATLERLSQGDFKNLRKFAQTPRPETVQRSFDSWLYGAVDFAVRDHLRKRYGRAPKSSEVAQQPRPSRRDLQSHAGRLDDLAVDRVLLHTLQMTTKLTAGEIFAFAAEHFSADELRALKLYYIEEQSYEELGAALGLAQRGDAEKLIRKLNARLRYQFQAKPEPNDDVG